MSYPELTALTRQVEQSSPQDREAHRRCLTALDEVSEFVRSNCSPDMDLCLQSAARALEALTRPSNRLDCAAIHVVVKHLLRTVERCVLPFDAPAAPQPAPAPEAQQPSEEPAKTPPSADAASAKGDEPALELRLRPAEGGTEGSTETAMSAENEWREAAEAEAEDTADPEAPAAEEPAQTPKRKELELRVEESAAEPKPEEPAQEADAEEAEDENPVNRDRLLGRILVELGHITREQLADALRFHRDKGLPIGESLLLRGCTSPDRLLEALSLQERMRELPTEDEEEQQTAAEEAPAAPTPAPAPAPAAPAAQNRPKPSAPRPARPAADLMVTKDMFIGEVLLGAEMITNDELEQAMHMHHHDGLRVGEALVKLGAISQEELENGLELQRHLCKIATRTARPRSH
ncbi:MAG: hypothetical protein AAF682_15435 [Planctomycetota bacterium]